MFSLQRTTLESALQTSSTATLAHPKGDNTYNVNVRDLHGWFAVDYTLNDLKNTTFYVQNVFTRPSAFDGTSQILTPDDLADLVALNGKRMWLNLDYDMFYAQHKLDGAKYIQDSAQFRTDRQVSLKFNKRMEFSHLILPGAKLNPSDLLLKFLSRIATC